MMPMSRWPSSIRCRVAAYAPLQSAEPIVGTSGPGCPAGSSITNGMLRERSCRFCTSGRLQTTRMTPTGRRLSTPSIQSRSGFWRSLVPETTRPTPCSRASRSMAAMASAAQELAISKHSTSISGAWFGPGLRRLYWRSCSSASIRARVSSETPVRPLSTLETVEIETSARAASSARVARLAGSPAGISTDMRPD